MFIGSANRWLSIPVVLVLAGTACAQTESQIESDAVKRVGRHLTCQCGCKDDVNCMMSAGQCPVCKPIRAKIFRMQQSGVDDSSIVAAFVKELGEKVFRPDPGLSFWLVPYFALGAGGLLLAFRLRKMIDRGQRQPLIPQRDRSDVDLAHCIEAVSESTERLD